MNKDMTVEEAVDMVKLTAQEEVLRLRGLLGKAKKVLLQNGGCGCGECRDEIQTMLKKLDEF